MSFLPPDLSENLFKSNKVVVVEDNANVPDKSTVVARALCNQENNEVSVYYSELPHGDQKDGEQIEDFDVQNMMKLTTTSRIIGLFSITPIVFANSLQRILQFLQKLKKSEKVIALIFTIHGDCHDQQTMEILKMHSDLWLKVTSLNFERTKLTKNHPKGKVEHIDYDLKIENGKLLSAKVSPKVEHIKQSIQVDEDTSILPTSSFNLNLSEKEKEDRSKVEMPFWKKKESKIEYIPDENDDWDDEDPDDDLDI